MSIDVYFGLLAGEPLERPARLQLQFGGNPTSGERTLKAILQPLTRSPVYLEKAQTPDNRPAHPKWLHALAEADLRGKIVPFTSYLFDNMLADNMLERLDA